MKIYIPNFQKLIETVGGGNTFTKNFVNYLPDEHSIVPNIKDCDVFFIVGPTTATRDQVNEAKNLGKKIVLRLDGVCEDWRNRGTGTPRMLEFCDMADKVIYQSEFIVNTVVEMIEQKLERRLNKKLIYNGVDATVFNRFGDHIDTQNTIYLHVHYRKDPNKRFEEVIHTFRDVWLRNKEVRLWIVGRVPTMFKEHNLGFFNGEKYKFFGVKTGAELATIMRSADYHIYPSYADPAPNVVLETLACGLELINTNGYGGTRELVEKWRQGFDFSMERCVEEYLDEFN